ncbi:MAG: dihydrolipoamide acetyltransferase family protein [Planctomycetota bacterium]|nr:2-oxo acid dehydrogenase subunit E2 [Planctomycetota bacterium]
MANEFKLPDLGENIASGDVVSVFVSAGDVLKPGQAILEVETDKAVIEVPCPPGGVVSKVLVKKGDTVKVGQALVVLDATGAGAAKPAAAPATAAPVAAQPAAAPVPAAPTPAPAAPAAPVSVPQRSAPAVSPAPVAVDEPSGVAAVEPAGPAVRRLARELGVDLGRVKGTGPAGRIVREDVIAAVRHASASPQVRSRPESKSTERDDWGPIRREQMSRMRKTIAANMVRSVQTIPHLTNFDDADVTELEALRKASAPEYAKNNLKLTALAFVIKSVSLSLRQHPAINATVDMEKGEVVYKDYVNVGLAVDTPRGLVVPVLRDCDQMSIPQIAQAIADTAEKAKNAQYGIEDLRGGTFTISNLGAVGGAYSTPIINWPEVAILLLGRSRKMPVVHEDKIEPRLMMPLSLSYDHRIVDGAMAARFLNEVIGYLQSPGRLLLAM